MDFLTTARLLMDLDKQHKHMWYEFKDGMVVIQIPVADDVAELFSQAAEMFAPA